VGLGGAEGQRSHLHITAVAENQAAIWAVFGDYASWAGGTLHKSLGPSLGATQKGVAIGVWANQGVSGRFVANRLGPQAIDATRPVALKATAAVNVTEHYFAAAEASWALKAFKVDVAHFDSPFLTAPCGHTDIIHAWADMSSTRRKFIFHRIAMRFGKPDQP
jgi:hypothetical protein